MKKLKKVLLGALLGVATFALVACGGRDGENVLRIGQPPCPIMKY